MVNSGSNTSAHALLNVINELGKIDKYVLCTYSNDICIGYRSYITIKKELSGNDLRPTYSFLLAPSKMVMELLNIRILHILTKYVVRLANKLIFFAN